MKSSQVPFLPLGIGAVFVSAITFSLYGQFLQGDQTRRERFRVRGATNFEGPAGSFERSGRKVSPGVEMTEAPTGFDNLSNGFDGQGPPFEQINEDTVVPLRSFNDNQFIFEEVEANADGLGPTYNAQSCRECHQNAYLNEMGITSPLFPEENTSSGVFVGFGTPYDPVPDPEDDGVDIVAFANFMRATKAPARGEISADVRAGEELFTKVGCTVCHVPAVTTARPGTKINGGVFTVPHALGNKIIHPYSDFLLHDIGTGTAFHSCHCLNLPRRRIKSAPPRFGRSAREIG